VTVPFRLLARRRAQRASLFAAVSTAGIVLAAACSPATTSTTAAAPAAGLNSLQHIVVVYMENWSFDSLYGKFPGADGLAGAGRTTQVDKAGVPYAQLPQPLDSTKAAKPTPAIPTPPKPADPRFPASLSNGPFNLETYVPPTNTIGDLGDGFYQEQAAIDGGRMDKFVATGGVGALPLGYYDASPLPLGQLAKQYTLDDHFFHAAFGTSMLNHFWLIAGATPSWPDAPASMRAVLGPNGQLVKDGPVTPDGYLVNTAYPADGPHPATTPASKLVPPLHTATIGDRLSAKGISWAWYAGGWNNALAGHPDPLFQFNHQPFAYFANYANGTPGQAAHLKDQSDLVTAIRTNTLPAVSFYKPIGADNEHPGYANLLDGERNAASLINRIMASPAGKNTAIIVTYDENGGFWDHVPPPLTDIWGPGTRVPTIVISPFAKKGFVDHTDYDTTSILALIEHRYNLTPLGPRDATAADLQNTFTF
jgi:phospholipase C